MYELGKRVNSSIHGPATILIHHKEMVGVRFDSSTYPDQSVDCWYQKDDTGAYVAGHGIDVLTEAND